MLTVPFRTLSQSSLFPLPFIHLSVYPSVSCHRLYNVHKESSSDKTSSQRFLESAFTFSLGFRRRDIYNWQKHGPSVFPGFIIAKTKSLGNDYNAIVVWSLPSKPTLTSSSEAGGRQRWSTMILSTRLYSDPPLARNAHQNNPSILVSWWCTGFAFAIIIVRLAGRYIRTEKLFREDKVMALSIIPLLARMACVHLILRWGTNNAITTGLSPLEIRHREIGSKLVLCSRIFYAAL